MTVRELINALKEFPEDMLVLTDGYESEYEHILQPKTIDVIHKPNNPYYNGEFEWQEKAASKSFQAVVISRNVRDLNI